MRPRHFVDVVLRVDLFEQLPHNTWVKLLKLMAKDRCEECGSEQNLHAHHMDKNTENNCLANGICLCASCHANWHVELRQKTALTGL